MLAARRRKRAQLLVVGAVLGVGLYVGLVYQPLSRRAAALDRPLMEVWRELSEVNLAAPLFAGDRQPEIDAALRHVRESIDALERTRLAMGARIEPGPGLAERVQAPFQLIEFQNERQLVTEEVWRLARQKKVNLDPGLTGGFPEYMADRARPSLLWVQLSLLRHTLTAAINSGVTLVRVIRSPAVRLYQGQPARGDFLATVPLEVEMVAPAPAAARFLETLPLRSEEITAAGLPEAGPDKPAYFIERIYVLKESKEKVDEVRVRVTLSSLIYLAGD
jgi:hypothetical protein